MPFSKSTGEFVWRTYYIGQASEQSNFKNPRVNCAHNEMPLTIRAIFEPILFCMVNILAKLLKNRIKTRVNLTRERVDTDGQTDRPHGKDNSLLKSNWSRSKNEEYCAINNITSILDLILDFINELDIIL